MRIERSLGTPRRTEFGRSGRLAAVIVAIAVLVAACGGQTTPAPTTTAGASPTPGESAAASPAGESADVIFTDANVVTMDDAHPSAQAVAVKGDTIMAVGTNEEIAKLRGPGTGAVSLGGKTLVPGFTDTHQHRIGDGGATLGLEPKVLIDAAIEQGYTTIDELYVDQGRLDQLRALDQSGVLRLRVNAYLVVQENSAEGKPLGDYFDAFQQGQVVSPHVRIAGLKVFTDFANATILLWQQADLDAFLLARYREGWHLAIKTVSTRSLAMILKALQPIQAADLTLVDLRARTEHTLFATADQIAAMKALGLVPIINLNNPGQLVGMPDVDQLIASEPAGSYTPWKSMFDAGLQPAGMSGFPSLYADEPTGAPFGSPIHLIYQGVTRAGNLGVKSPAALLGEALTADQAMRAMTIHAARAGWEDDVKGSITVGKLADLVVLSGDPLTVPAEQINDIGVLMTMIGGKVEWCAPGSEAVCPVPGGGGGGGDGATPTPQPTAGPPGPSGANIAPTATVTASSELPDYPATNVNDRTGAYWNAAALSRQWVQLALPVPADLAAIRLTVAQDPGGPSVHEIWIRRSGGELEKVKTFDLVTNEGDVLVYQPAEPMPGVDLVKVVTTGLVDLFPAWHEIELITP